MTQAIAPSLVDVDQTQMDVSSLRDAFVQDWIDSPAWTQRWLQESATQQQSKPMQSNRFCINYEPVLRRASELSDDGSWRDISYQQSSRENWAAADHFAKGLHPMAVAYASAASPLFRDSRLQSAILSALNFWLQNDFRNPNWWFQHIGLPGYLLGPVLLYMREDLTPPQITKGIEILERCDLKRHNNWRTGGNCLFDCRAGLVSGLFADDRELVARIFSTMLYKELHLTPAQGSGVKEDYSQWEHGNLLFNHGYGAVLLVEGGRLMSIARQARIPIHEPALKFLTDYLLDGCRWMARGSFLDYAANGRGVAVPDSSKGNGTTAAENVSYLAVGARYLLRAGATRAPELEAVIDCALGIAEPISGNRLFYISDFLVHRRPDFYLSVRGYSTRTLNTEICNSTNRLGHHLGEGSIYLVRRGDEYEDIFPVWDWRKVPGTTTNLSSLDDAELDENPDSGWFPSVDPADEGYGRARLRVSRRGRTDFVGGASDGSSGLFTIDLKVLSLAARKSYWCLDDGVVCIGSGISDTQQSPVITTVNQCRLIGEVYVVHSDGNVHQLDAGTHALSGVRLVWHDNIAYFFAAGQHVVCSNTTQAGNWRRINLNQSEQELKMQVFSLWINHGSCPVSEQYVYRIRAGVSFEEAMHDSKSEAITMLSHTHRLHSARDNRTGNIGATFFHPGVLWVSNELDIHVSHPCVLMINPKDKKIAVADPTQSSLTINIGVRGTNSMYFVPVSGGRTTTMDFEMS